MRPDIESGVFDVTALAVERMVDNLVGFPLVHVVGPEVRAAGFYAVPYLNPWRAHASPAFHGVHYLPRFSYGLTVAITLAVIRITGTIVHVLGSLLE